MEIVLSGGDRIIVGTMSTRQRWLDRSATSAWLPCSAAHGREVGRFEELARVRDGRPFGGKDPRALWRGREIQMLNA